MIKRNDRSEQSVPSLTDTIADPQAFVLSLIGAEVLATKREDGPLARPWRSQLSRTGGNNKEGSRG